MPEGFTHSFAERLNRACKISVVEAVDKAPIVPGRAYIAPGHSHLYIERINGTLYTRLSQEPPVNRHRPSVEVLFLSAAKVVEKNAVGVMFTGMGKDGALAMLKMREAGAYNIAQDKATSVVYGMPREAAFVGAVQEILPLPEMSSRVLALVGA
jgi:two-component system chemotaxis response regulator CheB